MLPIHQIAPRFQFCREFPIANRRSATWITSTVLRTLCCPAVAQTSTFPYVEIMARIRPVFRRSLPKTRNWLQETIECIPEVLRKARPNKRQPRQIFHLHRPNPASQSALQEVQTPSGVTITEFRALQRAFADLWNEVASLKCQVTDLKRMVLRSAHILLSADVPPIGSYLSIAHTPRSAHIFECAKQPLVPCMHSIRS